MKNSPCLVLYLSLDPSPDTVYIIICVALTQVTTIMEVSEAHDVTKKRRVEIVTEYALQEV